MTEGTSTNAGAAANAAAKNISIKCSALLCGAISLIISGVMAGLYGSALSKFDDENFICTATRGEVGALETVDVGEKWKFVITFGFGCYLAMVFLAILAMFSGFNVILAVVNMVIQSCCINIPILVQTIYLFVYRFMWYG